MGAGSRMVRERPLRRERAGVAVALASMAGAALTLWAWTGVSTPVASVWLAHGSVHFENTLHEFPSDEGTADTGRLAVRWQWLSEFPGYDMGARVRMFDHAPRWERWTRFRGEPTASAVSSHQLVCPLYIPGAIGAGIFGVCFVRRRRRELRERRFACVGCGYDLSGLCAEAVCPECGARRDAVASATAP